jgi:GR25 family glycosyltransferase involved in LPS biosynthesis
MTNIYDYFEDVVCINLDISKDRREHAQKYFDDLNIPARFFITTKHKKGGIYGCFESHIKILIDAYERGLNNILVFEDDFLPTSSYSDENLQKAIDFMKSNEDWDIFHLGYIWVKDNTDGISTIFNADFCTPDIVQYNPFCTHSLCYSKKAIKRIVETYQDYIGVIHFDMYISSFENFKNYCIVPMLFDQNFHFEHNNQSKDGIEFLARSMFPLFASSQLNYRMSILKKWMYKNNRYAIYVYLLISSICLYLVKSSIYMTYRKK